MADTAMEERAPLLTPDVRVSCLKTIDSPKVSDFPGPQPL